ncbi:MAG: hypothetical protein RMY16_02805 [Nostoc sp. DedQUE12b]|uniref:hypothetical protein n=1 Tax=Nostoc sp. DedQUE12b TaxID=3075398 RepID=UPI002AD349B6|nr:hypothetical protein [Nostoc sp. DedQUE12b]MDZ8084514.1 hypothetical protein [Nostoc sp. DedQUE12b]
MLLFSSLLQSPRFSQELLSTLEATTRRSRFAVLAVTRKLPHFHCDRIEPTPFKMHHKRVKLN